MGLNLFSKVKSKLDEDMVVLFYRSSLKQDMQLLSKYLELKEYFQGKKVNLHYYDINKNSTFKDLQ